MLIRIEVPELEMLMVLNHPAVQYGKNRLWWRASRAVTNDVIAFVSAMANRREDPVTVVMIKAANGRDRAWHKSARAPIFGTSTSMRHYSTQERNEDMLKRAEYAEAKRAQREGSDETEAECNPFFVPGAEEVA